MKKTKVIYLMLAAVMVLASCASTDDTEATLYSDAAITSFTLGNLKYTYDGKTTEYAGSSYPFKIDQVARRIENTKQIGSTVEDSYWLPVGTYLKKVVCTIGTRNNGSVFIKNVDDGDFAYHNATDSIDFSKDGTRTFRVYASDGSGYTDYVVKLNVHTVLGSKFQWNLQSGMTPTTPTLPTGVKQLLGTSTLEEYAVMTDGTLKERVIGDTEWKAISDGKDKNETDDAMLPTQDVGLVSYPLYLSDDTDYVLLVGTLKKTVKDDAGNMVDKYVTTVWRKIVDYSSGKPVGQWVYMKREEDDKYQLEPKTGLSLVRFEDVVLAFGGDYKTIYKSRDNGITWTPTKNLPMPTTDEGFKYEGLTSIRAYTDKDQFIWLECSGTNQVWKGRYNRMAWE